MATTPIRYRQVRTRQPQRPVRVDWSNPLNKGLIFAWTGSSPLLNAVKYTAPEFINGAYYFDVARDRGIVRKTTANGTIEQRFRNLTSIPADTPLTYGVAMRLVTYHPEGGYVLTNDAFAAHFIRVNSLLKIEGGANSFVANSLVTSDNAYSSGDWLYVVMTARNGAWTMYVNGVKQSMVATGGLSQTFENRVDLNGSGLEFLTGFASAGAWSEAQILSWTRNPWQLFDQNSSVYFFESSTVLPPLVTNTNTFYSPTVSAGAVTLTPSRYDNTNSFYSAFVNINGEVLQPSLYTNGQTFYGPVVSSSSTSDNYSSPMSRGIFRGIERGVA